MGCGSGDESTDITDAIFTNRSTDCEDCVGSFFSDVHDESQGVDFEGSVEITLADGSSTLSSNSIPNHDFGGGDAAFAEPAG